MREIVLLDGFSGIGGFAKGFERAGFKIKKHYFSEIDRHAIANYKYHYPDAEYLGAIEHIRGGIERPDIFTFGFPCQDVSIAGKREGYKGKRSSLFFEAVRIIRETRPHTFIFENVKGLFSSHQGRDFTATLQAIADLGIYECEWQLCNTKWLLPQNRERVFFVGHLAGGSSPKVFPITENEILLARTKDAEQSQSQTKHRISNTLRGKTMRSDDTYVLVEPNHKHGGDLRVYEDECPTIQSRYGTGGDNIPYVVQVSNNKESNGVQPYQQNRVYDSKGQAPALNSFAGRLGVEIPEEELMLRSSRDNRSTLRAARTTEVGVAGKSIRRLTEIECERLQGFEDDHSKYGNYDGEIKELTSGHRYRMIGNAVTVDIVKLIAERL